MGNRFFMKLTGGIMLSAFALAFSSCEDDYEPSFPSYGMVTSSGTTLGGVFAITLDNGYLVYPQEYSNSLAQLDDSTRLYMHYNILSQQDSSANIRILYADTILTKPILAYDESILDSIGNDPFRKISRIWFAHGFLNLEFTYLGSGYRSHMVNLLHHPSTEDGEWVFEFRHNSFDDPRERVYMGAVSFPITKIFEGVEKPIEIVLKYKESPTSDRSIKVIYK